MVIHPKRDGPYLTMVLVICEDNNELVYHACVCVKIVPTLPYIASLVKYEQAMNKLKNCFSVYSLKAVSCLFLFSFPLGSFNNIILSCSLFFCCLCFLRQK